jgi:hypothetical protein
MQTVERACKSRILQVYHGDWLPNRAPSMLQENGLTLNILQDKHGVRLEKEYLIWLLTQLPNLKKLSFGPSDNLIIIWDSLQNQKTI